MDSQPDSWGRRLLRLASRIRSEQQGRPAAVLSEADMLLAVSDLMRSGALRFFHGDEPCAGVSVTPAKTGDLERLAVLARRFEMGELLPQGDLDFLSGSGAALGGSRPKAGFQDDSGRLWVAKFPSVYDDRDMAAWQWVAMTLAARAGIRVPAFSLAEAGAGGRAFVTRRFDRTDAGGRRHFFSVRALLGSEAATSERSYLVILSLAEKLDGRSGLQAEELWRRVAFRILTGDGDDHLRNNGFLLGDHGWELAPAYDLNPSPSSSELSLVWDERCTSLSPKGFLAAAPWWGLNPCRAREIMDEVREAVAGWRTVADQAGISRREMENMAPAFRAADESFTCQRGCSNSQGGWSFHLRGCSDGHCGDAR